MATEQELVAATQADRSVTRPTLPRQWLTPTPLGFVSTVAAPYLSIVGSSAISVLIVYSSLPALAKCALLLPSITFAGHGYHLAGWVGHEGVHLSLLRNKSASMALGVVVSAMAFFPAVGYGMNHFSHHRYTNQPKDPDAKLFSRQRTFWQRFFGSRFAANREYWQNTWQAASRGPLPEDCHVPLRERQLRTFARLNFLAVAAWAVAYLALGVTYPAALVFGVLLPLFVAIPMTGLRPFVEHGGLIAGTFRDSRSYVAPMWTLLLGGNNYHLEHHLYPSVPCYHLPKVHRWLAQQGVFQVHDSPLDTTFLAPLRTLTSRYPYPDGTAQVAAERARTTSAVIRDASERMPAVEIATQAGSTRVDF